MFKGLMAFILGFTFAQAQGFSPDSKAMGFGQMLERTPIGLRIISSDTYMNYLDLKKNSEVEKPTLYSTLVSPSLNYLYANNLRMHVSEESLQPRTPLWKQAGIYGLEFVVAGLSSTLMVPLATISIVDGDPEYWHYKQWPIVYSVGNSLLTSSCTWGIGKLLGQKGTWWKSAIGAGLGGFIGGYYLTTGNSFKEGVWTWTIVIGLASSGAVIGFNF